MVSISSINASNPEPQKSAQNTNTTQKTADDNIWSKYDDNKDLNINISDTNIKTIYDTMMKKVETLSEKFKSSIQNAVSDLFINGYSYEQTTESIKNTEEKFEVAKQNIDNRINMAIELKEVAPDKIIAHPRDNSIVQLKKNNESVIIIPMKDGERYMVYRQSAEPLPDSKKDRANYSEIEKREYESFDTMREDMASESYGWGRTTLKNNHPNKKSKQDLSLMALGIRQLGDTQIVELHGYDKFE